MAALLSEISTHLKVLCADKGFMERRREPRIETYQSVDLTVLDEDSETIEGRAVQLSGHGLRIVTEQPLPINAPVKVQSEDWLALGEICYCQRERMHYAIGIQIDQVMTGLRELQGLGRTVMGVKSALIHH